MFFVACIRTVVTLLCAYQSSAVQQDVTRFRFCETLSRNAYDKYGADLYCHEFGSVRGRTWFVWKQTYGSVGKRVAFCRFSFVLRLTRFCQFPYVASTHLKRRVVLEIFARARTHTPSFLFCYRNWLLLFVACLLVHIPPPSPHCVKKSHAQLTRVHSYVTCHSRPLPDGQNRTIFVGRNALSKFDWLLLFHFLSLAYGLLAIPFFTAQNFFSFSLRFLLISSD